MPRAIVLAAVTALLLAVLPAQQTGGANRDYTINSNGGSQPSYVVNTICAGLQPLNQFYHTQDPYAPVIWAAATSATVGWYTSATNYVDIGPGGLTFLLDGTFLTSPSPAGYFAVTNSSGNFPLNVPTSPSLAGMNLYLAMAHFAASSPDGFWMSQTHLVRFDGNPGVGSNLPPSSGTACHPASVVVPLFNDDFSQQPLQGAGFAWYGTTYTECFVNSNGSVTFGNGDPSSFEGAVPLSVGPPRIAQLWDDLNPSGGGTVRFRADPTGGFEVCFDAVPESFNTGSNTFRLTAVAGASVRMDYATNVTIVDGLVGVSPGGGAAVLSTNLSQPDPGGTVIPPGTGLYERFGLSCGSPFDLHGVQVTFDLDSSGNPTTQF